MANGWRWMVVCLLVFGGVLGIRLYVEPRLYWRDLWFLLIPIASPMLVWLSLSAPRSARFPAVGFVFGVIIEFVALSYVVTYELIALTPGSWMPEGWYPLTIPVTRLLISRGWVVFPQAILPGMYIGMVFSGMAGCIMMLTMRSLWTVVEKWIRF